MLHEHSKFTSPTEPLEEDRLPDDGSDSPLLLHQLFQDAAHAAFHQPLVDFYGREFTYGQIAIEAARVARGLQALGVDRSHKVGLLLPNIPQYVSAYYGISMAGAVIVNFSPLYTAEDIIRQIEDSGTEVLITMNSALLLPKAIEALDKSSLRHVVVARLDTRLSLMRSVLFRLFKSDETADIPDRPDVSRFQELVDNEGDYRAWIGDPTSALAMLQYTGGTTGQPKGAMLTHANLTTNAHQLLFVDPVRGGEDRIIGALPLFHIFANTVILNRTVANRGAIIMLPRFSAYDVADAIARTRPTALPGVPSMFETLLDHPRFPGIDWSSLATCVVGGAPLPERLATRFEKSTGIALTQGYGLTETAGVVAANRTGDQVLPSCVGAPLAGTSIRIVDPDAPHEDVSAGALGEILVSGPQVMSGYLNEPPGTQFSGKYLRTGDIGHLDRDGRLHVVDRIKDMISVGGFKAYPRNIEDVLRSHPDIIDAAVVAKPHERLGEVPQAFVVQRRGKPLGIFQAMEWVNERVSKHERLFGLEFVDELPRTPIGKLDRKSIRQERVIERMVA